MKHGAAYARARETFEAGYGCKLDLSDETDVAAFLPILEEEITRDVEARLAASIRAGAARLLGIGSTAIA